MFTVLDDGRGFVASCWHLMSCEFLMGGLRGGWLKTVSDFLMLASNNPYANEN
jgi:hypothetical protein